MVRTGCGTAAFLHQASGMSRAAASLGSGRPDQGIRILLLSGLHALLSACHASGLTEPRLPLPDGGAIAVPAQCRVEGDGHRPYRITFRFKNAGSTAITYHHGCWPGFEVSSCASGYTDQLAGRLFCPCACSADRGCPVCGGCAGGAAELPAGQHIDLSWEASIAVLSKRGDRECHESRPLPAGLYRVSMAIYGSPEDAMKEVSPVRVVAREFALPAPGDTLEISLSE